jgi:Spy/CpxP family protein refolding chaperone
MKTSQLMVGVLAAVLALPLAVSAQQTQPPPPPAQAQGPVTPNESVMQHRWAKHLGGLNLSSQQQQQIQSIVHQYSQAHPAGSPRDPQGARDVRRQIMGVLSPDQQNQFHQQMQARRAQMRQRREQMEQSGGQQGPPPGQQPPDQGPPPGQQPPPPPDQQPPNPPSA